MENINLDKIIKVDELDFNMILNVSEEIGEKLHRLIQGQATQEEKENTSIQIIENPSTSLDLDESRKMIFKINNQLHPMTILDFPCIIEANKTIDSKTFYKSSDIAQMMYVHDSTIVREDDVSAFNPFQANEEPFNKIIWKKDLDHKYKLKHGLARCTRHIRTRRFKRKIRYNHEEILEVAKKLKSIIDNGAASFENQNKTNTEFEEDRKSIISNNKKNRGEIASSNIIMPTNGLNVNNSIISSNNNTKKKTNKKNNSLNISLPLMQNDIIKASYQSDLFTNTLSQDMNNNNINPFGSNEKSDLMEEYKRKKNDYKRLKKELEGLDDKPIEMIKQKKLLKKELKILKVKYKEI